MKPRLPKLARWLAGIYLAWGLLVFFGSFGSETHSGWPIFLYPLIWPFSLLFQMVSTIFSNAIYDYVAAAFYIGFGTIWIWCLGHLFSRLVTRLFPFKNEKTVATKS